MHWHSQRHACCSLSIPHRDGVVLHLLFVVWNAGISFLMSSPHGSLAPPVLWALMEGGNTFVFHRADHREHS